jgi:AcrR family transcriptional regulator
VASTPAGQSDAAAPDAPRRGRRKSTDTGEGTRAEIISAARAEFADKGYDSTSLRAVARRAGVDAALVHHYFADKADLFAATVEVPLRPDLIVAEILRGPRDAIGVTIIRTIVTRLDDSSVSDAVLGIIRTSLGHEFAARMLRQFMVREVLGRVVAALDVEDAELRASLAASQIIGLVIARYGLRLGAIAEAPADDVIARVGAVVQWHLVGDRPPGS